MISFGAPKSPSKIQLRKEPEISPNRNHMISEQERMGMIYLASSWRNKEQPRILQMLRHHGYEVYDFRNPPNRSGFGWEQICKGWEQWTVDEYLDALSHPLAEAGFREDMQHLWIANVVVLLLPSGRSAHSEAAFNTGRGKPTIVHMPEPCEPELMYKMFTQITTTDIDLLGTLASLQCLPPWPKF